MQVKGGDSINNLINISDKEGVLVTESREVSFNFEKAHKNVLQNIDNLIVQMSSAEKSAQYFIPDEYRDSSGKLNRQYLLTRDGFTLLVMGFTGQKAVQWKLKYIEAFNSMEKAIKDNKLQLEAIQLQCIKETNKTLKFIQDKNLRDSIARQALSKLYDIEVPIAEISTSHITSDTTVKEFITVQCEKDSSYYSKLEDLFQCYDAWCKLNHFKALTKNNFGRHMRLLGFEQGVKHGTGRYWIGIKIKTERR